MGIMRFALEDEHGDPWSENSENQGDPHVLDSLLPFEDHSYKCWRFIDPDGDTVFNRMQMEQFLLEWDRLFHQAKGAEQESMMMQVKELAQECQSEPHSYLKFYGDLVNHRTD